METLKLFKEHLTTLYIEIASGCNLNCSYCYNDSGSQKDTTLPLETIRRLLMPTGGIGRISTIILSGGEPFLYPEISTLLAMINNLGYVLRIYTNGTLLTRETIKMLASYRPNLQITLDSANEETNDLYKGKGAFRKICRALALLREEYYMENVTVRCNLNYELLNSDTAILDYIRLLEQLGVKVAYFALINNQGRARSCTYPTKSVDMESLKIFRDRVLALPHQSSLALEVPIASVCQSCPYAAVDKYQGSYLLHITPDGNVYPCSALAYTKYVLGNICQSDISDICSGSALRSFIESVKKRVQSNPVCSPCPYQSFCGKGCLGELPVTENLEGVDGQCAYRKKEIAKLLREKVRG